MYGLTTIKFEKIWWDILHINPNISLLKSNLLYISLVTQEKDETEEPKNTETRSTQNINEQVDSSKQLSFIRFP